METMLFHITPFILDFILHLGGLNEQFGTQEKMPWGAR